MIRRRRWQRQECGNHVAGATRMWHSCRCGARVRVTQVTVVARSAAGVADGLPDAEGGQAFGGFGVDGDVVDDGSAGTVAGPVDEEADVVGRPFEDGFDAAVGQVAYPAAHVMLLGRAPAAVAEEDPLDPPGHHDTVADHRAHRFALTRRAVSRAIMSSSSVGTTRAWTGPGRLIRPPVIRPWAALAAGSSARPRKPSRASTRLRTRTLFSPMPAVKTSASRPPRLAARPATALASRCTKTSRASPARSSPRSAASEMVRMSLLAPDSPSRPLLVSSTSVRSAAPAPVCSAR